MKNGAESLSIFLNIARQLEGRIGQRLTNRELWEIAQEAAASYHNVAIRLMTKEQNDREQLTSLSRRFSHIENSAMMKFYGKDHAGPTRPIL
jgi:hypothetical protein